MLNHVRDLTYGMRAMLTPAEAGGRRGLFRTERSSVRSKNAQRSSCRCTAVLDACELASAGFPAWTSGRTRVTALYEAQPNETALRVACYRVARQPSMIRSVQALIGRNGPRCRDVPFVAQVRRITARPPPRGQDACPQGPFGHVLPRRSSGGRCWKTPSLAFATDNF